MGLFSKQLQKALVPAEHLLQKSFKLFDNFRDSSCKFLVKCEGESNCLTCKRTVNFNIELDPVHFFDHGVNTAHPGSLHSGLEYIMNCSIVCKARSKRCEICQISVASVTNQQISMTNFLLMQLVLDKKAENMPNPNPVIRECMAVKGTRHKLTGAVQVTPGHFYAVVKYGDEFCVLDDMNIHALMFLSFAAAVKQQRNIQSTTLYPQQVIVLLARSCNLDCGVFSYRNPRQMAPSQ